MKVFTKFDIKMFQKAKEIAETSTYKTYSLGCVIVYKHHIIASGSNSNKTHPKQKIYNMKYRNFTKAIKPIVDSYHAEMRALCNISYPIGQKINWKKVRVYVYRICPGKKSGMGLAKPCSACLNALRDAGIQHLFYTDDNAYCYERLL